VTPHRPGNVARWRKLVALLPPDAWLTVPQVAALWWPDAYAGSSTAKIAARRRAEVYAHKRLPWLVSAGLVEVERRPHPTRAQQVVHVRRSVWKELGRWMVGEAPCLP